MQDFEVNQRQKEPQFIACGAWETGRC